MTRKEHEDQEQIEYLRQWQEKKQKCKNKKQKILEKLKRKLKMY